MAAIPVIFDTDIGDDIDDTWALAMLLKCPELDVKLITTAFRDTRYRAAIVAKTLEIAGRTDIPIGIGERRLDARSDYWVQRPWVEGYDLAAYRGVVHDDGVAALIDTIMSAPLDQPVTIIAIGPMTNLAAALAREPAIAKRTRIVGMLGCLRCSHSDITKPKAEYNVVMDIPAAQAALTAGWPITLTPLDTCGFVNLDGERYRRVLACDDALIRAMIDCYRNWDKVSRRPAQSHERSSVLFDTVAVHLAMTEQHLSMEDLTLSIDDGGMMRIAAGGAPVRCATRWTTLDRYKDELVDCLLRMERGRVGSFSAHR